MNGGLAYCYINIIGILTAIMSLWMGTTLSFLTFLHLLFSHISLNQMTPTLLYAQALLMTLVVSIFVIFLFWMYYLIKCYSNTPDPPIEIV